MASGSPRARIDQFYTSKKRRALSPGLKPGRNEKEVNRVEGSPSAKGTLDNYLVTSQDYANNDKSVSFAPGLPAGKDPVKRNLSSEINSSSKDGCKLDIFSSQPQAAEEFESTRRRTHGQLSELGDAAVGSFAVDNLALSLYCSDLQSREVSCPEIDRKRQASPLSICSSRKKHCIVNQSNLQCENSGTHEKNLKEIQSGVVDKTMPSLKKCSSTPKSFKDKADCFTPGSLIAKAFRQTSNSKLGSSIFSPGESFWQEAIQLADGLWVPIVDSCTQVGDADVQYHTKNSCNLRNVKCDDKLGKTINGGEKMDVVAALGSIGRLKKDLNEKSPLPVKHFDFSVEEKCLDEGIIDDSKSMVRRDDKPFESCLSNNNGISIANIANNCSNELEKEMHGQQKITFIAGTERKMDLAKKSTDNNESGESTPSSVMQFRDWLDLNSWLPSEICSVYRKKGIAKLYTWQVDCLQVDGVLQRKNLVYCASTSAGKSFVAEILMLRRVLSSGKMALLVLPYVSICAEKAEHLEVLLEPLGKHVRSYYGNQGGGTLPKDTSVAVCTIEKANSLLNRMLEEGRLSEIGIIVIDELHMVGDRHRGYLLELILTKLRYASGEGNSEASSGESSGSSSGKADLAHGLQIVGMSATMPNVTAVANWLHAALYQTDFRPVPLEEFIKVGNTIYNKKMEIVRTIPKAANLGGKDPDHIVEMCNEVVQEGHSVLIFCSSRKGCESTARHVSRFLKNPKASIKNEGNEIVDISSAIDALRKCPVGLDPVLEETLPFGVAYHHAGLTVEEREIVETCYRKGLVHVLTATSTLAAGVNLPARRVIFRQPRIGRDMIDGTRYRQMAGRAGRTGIDTKGESVLICKPDEIKRIRGLLNESCPPLYSCLSEDMNGMTHAILEVVAGGIVQTANDIHRYVRCTLLNSTKPFQEVVKSAQESLRWLCHKKFLEWNEETKLYSTTPLGRAAFGSSLSPEESLIVLDDLSRAREGFVLASDLHVVYLVTPTNVDVEPNWELFYGRFMELSAIDQSVGNRVGVVEPFLMRMAHGASIHAKRSKENMKSLPGNSGNLHGIMSHTLLSDDQALRVCKRFYVALILSRLVQEIPVTEVCEAFKVARGMVQTLQENAGRFASMVSVFCERLGWHDLEGLVSKFQNRVSFGVRAEIVELTTIPFVKGSRARALYKAGLRTPLAIAEASIPEIVKALFESSSWAAQEVSAQRHIQFGVAKKIKNGARKIVLEKAEEARIAAFSAFKSLGLNVPQISQPILSKVDGDPIEQRAATSSFVNDTNSSFVKVGQKENTDVPYLEEYDHSDKIAVVGGVKLTRTLDGVLASPKVNSTGIMKHGFGVDNSKIPLEGSVIYQDPLNPTVEDEKNDHTIHSVLLEKLDDGTILGEGSLDPGVGEGPSRVTPSSDCKFNGHEKGPVRAINNPGGFDSFLDLWDSTSEFYFDIHYNRRSEVSSGASFEIHGIAICWDNLTVYYIDIPKDLFWSGNKKSGSLLNSSSDTNNTFPPDHCLEIVRRRWDRINSIMGKINTKKFTWNLKVQIQVLRSPAVSVQKFGCWKFAWKNMGFEVLDSSFLLLTPTQIKNGIDISIISWILWPDEERSSNPNLEKEVKKRLSSEAAAAANQNGRWKNQMRRAAHNGCCRRVAQTRALCSVLWKLLVSEELIDVLLDIEIPLVNVLADMELWGIGVDMEGCFQARNLLGKKLRHLEKEAYKLAGITFSLFTTADIAHVLYRHLQLPLPQGRDKGKLHPSTDKQCLDLLRNEHPIVQVIKEHRKLAKLLNCTLGSICSLARLSVKTQKYTLHGHWLQTSTATGRLSMEEPNLQCVEHMVDFKISKGKDGNDDVDADYYKVNARDYFVPTQDDWLLLTADYSQIELRLMAHFSRDSSLIELFNDPHGDVFSMIAARWTGHPEDSICSNERDQTKRLVYGILYGMGQNTLAEQLDCSPDEAAEKIQSFKSSFPGVVSWLHEAVAICRKKGYVETLKGRKRFLSKIKLGNSKEKSKAQRQAVNSICQGSAADIIKVAMINIYSVIVEGIDRPDSTCSLSKKFPMLKGRCRILLQVHDELVLEVDQSVVKEAALLLKMGMENAASLLVPLNVKLKVGKTWGSLEPFQADQGRDKEFDSDS